MHVFDNIQIRFATDEEFVNATFYRKDINVDLALIKIEYQGASVRPARIRVSRVSEGERVFAIGNAQN